MPYFYMSRSIQNNNSSLGIKPILWIFAWVLFTLFVYFGQLSGGWRFDDGHHLQFLSRYSAFEYIYQPTAAKLQSGAHYTPFNILTYDLASRLFSLKQPAGFYAFHLLLLGSSAAALFFLLSRLFAKPAAIIGTLFFICGFPVAGISGQLMVGHYVLGFLFSGVSLYFYNQAVRDNRISIVSVAFYLLACFSKEIFLPLIVVVMIDPRVPIRSRLRSFSVYMIAASFFWLIRTAVVGKVVGGFNGGLPAPVFEGVANVISGLIAYCISLPFGFALGIVCVSALVGAVIVSFRTFGFLATAVIIAGTFAALVVPLLPVSLQIGPQAPTEIRLLSMIWYFLAFCAAVTINALGKKYGSWAFVVLGLVVASIVGANSYQYLQHSHLARIEQQFDAFTRYVIDRTSCNLVDSDGWSSWTHDLYSAIWPGTEHPIVGAEEIIREAAPLGTAICRYEEGKIVHTGMVDKASICNFEEPLAVTLQFNGSHVKFDFGPDPTGFYYVEVLGKYFLKLPSRFTGPMPDATRFEDIRIIRIMNDGGIACSPVLHFLPRQDPVLSWSQANTGLYAVITK